jgi:membrane-associated phospholipid phosphatase
LKRLALCSLLGIAALLGARSASAQTEPPPPAPMAQDRAWGPILWDPGWKSFGVSDYVVTGVAAGVAVTSGLVTPLPHHWYGGILFDNAVRNALEIRPNNIDDRYTARDTSDVLLSFAVTSPVFFDSMLTAWYQRRSPEVALQMALIDAEAFAIAGALQETTTALVSRQRPYVSDCGNGLPANTLDCTNPGQDRSFFSGHATLSFTAAGLTCEHHLRLRLFGGGAKDVLACIGALVLASATATLRVVSDQHYATDVLTGALVGSAVGIGVPALHYSGGQWTDKPGKVGGLELRFVPTGLGATVVGVFR